MLARDLLHGMLEEHRLVSDSKGVAVFQIDLHLCRAIFRVGRLDWDTQLIKSQTNLAQDELQLGPFV